MSLNINGTDGISLAGQFNSASTFGYRNRIINGAMVIDQRNAGASQTITGGASTLAFNCDRWQVRSQGANATVQQVATNNTYRMVFTGLASNSGVAAIQSIEAKNCADLAGQTVTISLVAKSTSLTSLTLELYYANTTDTFGTWGSPTVTSIGSQAVTISTTESTVSWSIAVPSAAYTGLQLRITSGALAATQTLTIGNVQLEKGSTATSFDYRPYGTELQLCQRYLPSVLGATNHFPAMAYSATGCLAMIPFPVTARTAPTGITVSSTSGFIAWKSNSANAGNPSSITFNAGGQYAGCLDVSGFAASSFTAGNMTTLQFNSSTGYVLFTGCEL